LEAFIKNGFEDTETILELNEEYLETIGVPLGHKLKIIKRIKQLKSENSVNESSQQNEISKTEATNGITAGLII
jgi:hypothetical protein